MVQVPFVQPHHFGRGHQVNTQFEIGRGSCRGRGEISGGAVSFKKKKKNLINRKPVVSTIRDYRRLPSINQTRLANHITIEAFSSSSSSSLSQSSSRVTSKTRMRW